MNKPLDINRINTVLSWGSIFVLSWLLLLRKLPVDGISVFFFCFFILVAFASWIGTVVEERQIHNSSKGESK